MFLYLSAFKRCPSLFKLSICLPLYTHLLYIIICDQVRRIEEFKNEKIIPHIVQEEVIEGNFLQYLYAQDILYANEIYELIPEVNNTNKDEEKRNE